MFQHGGVAFGVAEAKAPPARPHADGYDGEDSPGAYKEDDDPYAALEEPSAPPQPQFVFRPGADGQLQLVPLD
jgi:hypothetical protein